MAYLFLSRHFKGQCFLTHYTLEMVDISHFFFFKNPYPKFLVAQNCIKKGNRNMYFFFFIKFIAIWVQFCSTALVQSNIWHKKCLITNAVLENRPKNIYVSRSFFMQCCEFKTLDKLSGNIDHVYYTCNVYVFATRHLLSWHLAIKLHSWKMLKAFG